MRIQYMSRWAGVLAVMAVIGCNEHPVQPLDRVVTAVNRQENQLPAKTKIDFLFLVDNSGSMCEEQDNLTRNFSTFSDFLFNQLGASADYRIAVISTDMHPPNGHMGRFLAEPAPAVPALNCLDDRGEPRTPATEDCEDLVRSGELEPIIRSGRDGNIGTRCNNIVDPEEQRQCAQEDLERKFRCLATLGTGGDGFEKGLEAMRISLSCNGPGVDQDGRPLPGPNRQFFAACCREDGTYDPLCQPPEGQEPVFLRPDAVLVVVIITDEPDCSDPASNPPASNRAICKYGARDADGDGVPEGYRDQSICGDLSPAACFANECGAVPAGRTAQEWASECQAQRCAISRSENSNCEWFRNELTPVQDYVKFLSNLKAQPADQILVATIAGHRAYTSSGAEVTYNPGVPADRSCLSSEPTFDVDRCCPDGNCKGPVQPSCQSENGVAFSGSRYLALAEAFDINGIGCPGGPEDPDCVHICVDDFAGPLEQIRDKVATILGSYCMDKAPACEVPASGDQPARPCASAEEFANTDNYPIRVRIQCRRTEAEGGDCPAIIDKVLTRFDDAAYAQCLAERGAGAQVDCSQPDTWQLILNEPGCTGGALVALSSPPPAGAEVFVEFLVAVGQRRPNATDAGGEAPAQPGLDAGN